MSPKRQPLHIPGQNRILVTLEDAGEGRLLRSMQRVNLKPRTILQAPDKPITHAYFPLTGVASVVVNVEEGAGLEVGTTGNEGVVGIPLLLGSDRGTADVFVQIEGDFMQMTRLAFEEEVRRNGSFADVARRYAQGFLALAAQSAACLRYHYIEQRLCRWILMSHDRVGGDVLPLTQEFLALMLGVQRPGVSIAAAQLQKAGLITYRRGVITVLERQGLESGSCECYGVVRREFERLLC
jgi:CRP-like cAMP-binding protein